MKAMRLPGLALVLVCMTLLMASCGKSDNTDTPAAVDTTTVTGSVYAAPVNSASVVAKDDSGTVVAGPVTSASDGTYSIGIPTSALSGNLRIEATGGTFIDEATDAATVAGRLAAFAEGGTLSAGSAVHLDPSSTIIHDLVTSGSCTSVSIAMTRYGAVFGYMPNLSMSPQDPDAPITDGSDAPRRLAGLRAAAFSRIAFDLGLTPAQQFDLIKAIAKDLSDGTADGLNNGVAIEIVPGINLPTDWKAKFEMAMAAMANMRLTNSYKVAYMPGMGMMAPKTGKSKFQIRLTKRSDNTPATGLALKLKPLMHMANGMNHSTPMDIVSESTTTAGTYDCTAYYLMASGMSMGFWELKVEITDGASTESAMFFPPVGMAMGSTTVRSSLKGQADLILSSPTGTATEKRSYYLFNDGLMSSMTMSTHTFKVFTATKESMMFMPAVGTGTTLKNEVNAQWTVGTMTVDASTDTTTWIPATEGAVAGHWSIAGLTGLSTGQTGTIYVKMNVNSEDKTTNGMASSPTGTNGYATFIVTPM